MPIWRFVLLPGLIGSNGWAGVLMPSVDRVGRRTRTPVLNWFDTDAGRYLMQTRREQDGNTWITIAPTDSTRIVSQLGQLLNSLYAG